MKPFGASSGTRRAFLRLRSRSRATALTRSSVAGVERNSNASRNAGRVASEHGVTLGDQRQGVEFPGAGERGGFVHARHEIVPRDDLLDLGKGFSGGLLRADQRASDRRVESQLVLRQESLGKGEAYKRKPFDGTLRVTSPVRQSLASSRERVLRGVRGDPALRSVVAIEMKVGMPR